MLVFPINTLKVKYVQWHIELSIQRMNIEIKKKKDISIAHPKPLPVLRILQQMLV